MKNLRKTLCILLSMLLLLSVMPCAMANSDVTVTLDGEKIEFDVKPQILNDRTMVPLRAIFEAFGAEVSWDETTRTVTSTKGDKTIKLTIDSPIMYVNDAEVTLDSPAVIVDSRTLVPVRAVSESFDLKVDWIDSTRTVVILTNALTVTKESSHKYLRTVHPGDTVTYTFTVKNGTEEAKQFDITDEVPQYTIYKSGDAVVDGNNLAFSVDVASGETKTLSYTVTVKDDLSLCGTPIVSDSAEYLENKIPCEDVYIAVTFNEYDMDKVVQAMHALRNSEFTGKDLLAYYFRIAFSLNNSIDEHAPAVANALFVDTALANTEKYTSIVIPGLYGGKKIDDSHKARFKGEAADKVTYNDIFPGDVLLVLPSANDINSAKMYASDGITLFDITGKMTDVSTEFVLDSALSADYFAVLRPISASSSIAFIRSDAPYEGQTEVEKAVMATAEAFLLRGYNIQYADIHLAKALYRWERGKAPEDYTTDETGYTNCTGYMHDIYYNALGWDYGDHVLYESPESWFVFDYNLTGNETEAEIDAIEKKFMDVIRSGDIVYYRYSGNNHGMMYVGSGNLMHCTGSTYSYTNRRESEEAAIRYQRLITLFTPGNSRYLFQTDKPRSRFFILRPTNAWNGEIPASTRARMENMQGIIAEKTASYTLGQTVNPGENIAYKFTIYNTNNYPVTLDVQDVIPEGTTLVTSGISSENGTLSWKAELAPGEVKNISYVVKVNEDVKDGFVILSSEESKVGGIAVKCPPIFVGNALTEDEQNAVVSSAIKMADALKTGEETEIGITLADKIYKDALGVDVFGVNYEELRTALFIPNEFNKDIATEGKFADMVAPSLYGGHKLAQSEVRFLGERTRLPREKNLIVGDIFYIQDSPTPYSYIYVGNGEFIDLHTGEKCASYATLQVSLGWEEFAILRPSLTFED